MDNLLKNIKRTCTKCKIEKELEEFSTINNRNFKYNKNSVCKKCVSVYEKNRIMSDPLKKEKLYAKHKIYRDKNPNKYKGYIFPSKWKKLGIHFTKEMYYELLKKQNYTCAICNNVELRGDVQISLSVDHCHDTLKVRGLLCGNCNRAIGLFKDDPKLLQNAINYLNYL
jgi:hypothetical protein